MVTITPEPAPSTKPPRRRFATRVRRAWLLTAAVALIAVGLCQKLQPEGMAAITAIPPWCWLSALTLFVLPALWNASGWQRLTMFLLSMVFLAVCVEQTRSLPRSVRDAIHGLPAAPPAIRLVTINCNVGSKQVAAEVAEFKPDVVLLQESPDRDSVEALARSLFGDAPGVAWSSDCSIVARGELQPAFHQGRHFLQATWTLPGGSSVEIFCVRLAPPVVRYDLWSPSSWREHGAERRRHRQQIHELAEVIAAVPPNRPILLGGDFNAPAGDGALRELSPRLHDAFDLAGRGWGATVLNRMPVLRFDQLWCSGQLAPLRVWAVASEGSDHRLVVGEFNFVPSSGP
jgi:vancomycin resistance protein VanJ